MFRDGQTGPERFSMAGDEHTHWTRKLFVENARLYLPFLEHGKERADGEVDALARLFSEFGVPDGGRVLDLACGVGRHSAPLAKRGYEMTGVDISPLFIEKAREYAASEGVDARFEVGDALDLSETLAESAPFDVCINMFTSHSYYGREGDVRIFGGVADLCGPGALLVVMTANRDVIVRRFAPTGVERAGDVAIHQRRALDLETSVMMNVWDFFEGDAVFPSLTLEMDHRVYSLHEMKALLGDAGWEYRKGLGSAFETSGELTPLDLDSSRMWVVGTKK